jgi:hypothetical protein
MNSICYNIVHYSQPQPHDQERTPWIDVLPNAETQTPKVLSAVSRPEITELQPASNRNTTKKIEVLYLLM